ncbi:MAG: DUF4136 domain-containing protein [Aestuariibaculum sp.]
MKFLFKTLPFVALIVMATSCSSVRVSTDYDKNADFNSYKSFAFFKTGIDKAEISDLDKRRILRAIETEMLAKGFTKSDNPDLLISLFTKANQRVDVYNNYWGYGGWGWGGYYGPGWGWGWNQPNVSTSTEGMLYIDVIDAKKKELVWQGMGSGYLTQNMEKKEALIKEFVSKIMAQYPPGTQQK